MTEPGFFRTQMGRTFYDRTMPELVHQITRVADALERVVAALERNPESRVDVDTREPRR
jgi:hypothetical protein